jgi:hypothetical protein
MDVGVDFHIVILLFASAHVRGIARLQAARNRPYAYSYTRLVPSGLAGASFSSLVDMVFVMEGP